MSRFPGPSRLARLLARVRSLLRGLLARSDVEAEMREEFKHHIEMRTAHLEREGLSRTEASRRAHLEFGHTEAHRERARAARGLGLFDQIRFSWIDVKLGLRMLVKHPGLTAVSVLALGIGIPVGLAPMHLADALEAPLPEDPADRVRAIRYWNPVTTGVATPTREDFRRWSEGLTSFATLGAFRQASFNVASDDGRAAPVAGAQVTASTFEILGRPPLMGRPLHPADEAPGAPAVVVLGHDLWRSRFAGASDIVGRTVRLGQVLHTVVGVMPPGFRFPLDQQMWLPLTAAGVTGPEARASMRVFGRLAVGVSEREAQAELIALGPGVDAATSEEERPLRPEVVPFAMSFLGIPRAGLGSVPGFLFFQILALVLLLVACGNVAMLVFARTATRFRELAVRTALGASRLRIVSQVFVETLVLAVLAAGIGIFGVDRLLGHVDLAALAGESPVSSSSPTSPSRWRWADSPSRWRIGLRTGRRARGSPASRPTSSCRWRSGSRSVLREGTTSTVDASSSGWPRPSGYSWSVSRRSRACVPSRSRTPCPAWTIRHGPSRSTGPRTGRRGSASPSWTSTSSTR